MLKIFMLGLAGSAGRSAASIQQFESKWNDYSSCGESPIPPPPIQIIQGIDCRNSGWEEHVSFDMLNNRTNRFSSGKLSPGEICCAEGHKLMLRSFLNSELSAALFLEDDVMFNLHPQLLFKMWANRPSDCNTLVPHEDGFSEQVCIKHKKDYKKMSLATYFSFSYIMDRVGATELLKALTPTTEPADWPFKFQPERLGLWQLALPITSSNQNMNSIIG